VSIGIHRGVEIAGVLQIEPQVDVGFRDVRLRLYAPAIGMDRAWRVTQVLADQSKREPGAAVARSDIQDSFELDASGLQFARLPQACSKRQSCFDEIGRRVERSPKSDAGLARPVDRLQRRAQSRMIHRIQRSFSRAGEGEHRRFRLTCSVERLADLAPALDKVWKAHEQVFKFGPRFLIPRLDERQAVQERSLGSIGGQARGGFGPDSRLCKIFCRARRACREDQRRRMIGAQTQAGLCQARSAIVAAS